jgi:hypothetical protein
MSYRTTPPSSIFYHIAILEDRVDNLEKRLFRGQPYSGDITPGSDVGTIGFRLHTSIDLPYSMACLHDRITQLERRIIHKGPFGKVAVGIDVGSLGNRVIKEQNLFQVLADYDTRITDVERIIFTVGVTSRLTPITFREGIRSYDLGHDGFLYECTALTLGDYENYSIRVGDYSFDDANFRGIIIRTDPYLQSTFTSCTNVTLLSALAVDPLDNYYSAGSNGEAPTGPFVKWDNTGTVVWSKLLSVAGGYVYIHNFCYNWKTGGIAFAGTDANGHAIMGEIDVDGNIVHIKFISGTANYASHIAVDDIGNYWYGGRNWVGHADNDLVPNDAALFQDSVSIDGLAAKTGKGIYACGSAVQSGLVYMIIMKFDFGGGPSTPDKIIRISTPTPALQDATLSHIHFDDDDNLYADGFDGNHGFIIKLDSSDAVVWQKNLTYAVEDHLDGVRVNDENLFVAGNYHEYDYGLPGYRWKPIIFNTDISGEISECGLLSDTDYTVEAAAIAQDFPEESVDDVEYSMDDFVLTTETLTPPSTILCGSPPL